MSVFMVMTLVISLVLSATGMLYDQPSALALLVCSHVHEAVCCADLSGHECPEEETGTNEQPPGPICSCASELVCEHKDCAPNEPCKLEQGVMGVTSSGEDKYHLIDKESGTQSYHPTLAAALSAANESGSGDYTITAFGDDILDGELTIKENISVTLKSPDGDKYAITQNAEKRHFIVNGSLTLENIILEGLGSMSSRVNGGVKVNATGALSVNNGAVIRNCFSSKNGGGVFNSGLFNMSSADGIVNNLAVENGGGIYNTGTATMTGAARISDNKTYGHGGGVYNEGTFNMTDTAALTGNNAGKGGGASNVGEQAVFNLPTGTAVSDNIASIGGGIENSASLNIDGGTVSGNIADFGYGGGINHGANTALDIKNAAITGNSATTGNGGGIWIAYENLASLKVDADTVFSGNTAGYDFLRLAADDATYNANIKSTAWSERPSEDATDQGYNNYDISYTRIKAVFDENHSDAPPAGAGLKRSGPAMVAVSNGDVWSDATLPADPTRDGYDFTEWNTQADGRGLPVADGSTVLGNRQVTYYAQWLNASIDDKYTIGGAVGTVKGTGNQGGLGNNKTITIKVSWRIVDRDGVKEDFTTLTMTGNNSNPPSIRYTIQNVPHGATMTIWCEVLNSTEYKAIPGERIISPVEQPYSNQDFKILDKTWYGVTYKAPGYNGQLPVETSAFRQSSDVVKILFDPEPAWQDKVFLGWVLNDAQATRTYYGGKAVNAGFSNGSQSLSSGFTTVFGGSVRDIILNALWGYEVTFDSNNGTNATSQKSTQIEGQPLKAPGKMPTWNDYTLKNWNTRPDGKGLTYTVGTTPVNSKLTLYAQWTTVFTVTYDPNGGEAAKQTKTFEMGEKFTGPATQPLPPKGHYFDGWNSKIDGTGTTYSDSMEVTQSMTVYAKWSVREDYNVHFSANISSDPNVTDATLSNMPPNRNDVTYNTTISQPSGIPTRDGYAFAGWYKDVNSTAKWDFGTDKVTEDPTTLYAKWEIKTITVTYDSNGGLQGQQTKQHNWNTSLQAPAAEPTRDKHIFKGWNAKADGTGLAYTIGSTPVTGAVTLYAQWTRVYTVTFRVISLDGVANVKPSDKEWSIKTEDNIIPSQHVPSATNPSGTGKYPMFYNVASWHAGYTGGTTNAFTGAAWDFATDTLSDDLVLYAFDNVMWDTQSAKRVIAQSGFGTALVRDSFSLTETLSIAQGRAVAMRPIGAAEKVITTQGDYRHLDVSGALTLAENITLKNYDAVLYGGGVRVNSGGIFTLQGGKIAGNNAAIGGGVIINSSGTFNLQSGKVTGNSAPNGGGVYNNGDFIMTGGEVSGNTATQNGGGVYNIGVAKLLGGEISGNTAAQNGGGVYAAKISSIGISGTTSISSNEAAVNGGGIYTEDFASITGEDVKFSDTGADGEFSDTGADGEFSDAGADDKLCGIGPDVEFSGNKAGNAYRLGDYADTGSYTPGSHPDTAITVYELKALHGPAAAIKTTSFSAAPDDNARPFAFLANNYDLNFDGTGLTLLTPRLKVIPNASFGTGVLPTRRTLYGFDGGTDVAGSVNHVVNPGAQHVDDLNFKVENPLSGGWSLALHCTTFDKQSSAGAAPVAVNRNGVPLINAFDDHHTITMYNSSAFEADYALGHASIADGAGTWNWGRLLFDVKAEAEPGHQVSDEYQSTFTWTFKVVP